MICVNNYARNQVKATGGGFFSAQERPERFPRRAMLPSCWSRGLAREAGVAVLDRGFGSLAPRRILSVVEQREGASRPIMEALGFRIDHDRVTPEGRSFSHALSAEDWAAQTQ